MTGHDVKTLRTKLGLSQAELAARLNETDPQLRIYPSSVSRWESGRHDPSPHVAAALRVIARQSEDGDGLRASDHLELAAAGFEQDGSPALAAILRRLASAHRNGHDPLQVTSDAQRVN